jgi:hypothetical protein
MRHPSGSTTFDLERSLVLPRPLDKFCESTMRLERRLIEAGMRFPAGGSLLATGHRP